MERTIIFALFAVFISSSLATYNWTPSHHKQNGYPCSPYTRKPCGERKIIGETYYPCTNCRGPNVCKKVTTFQKHFYSCVYKKKCYKGYWSRYCKYYCVRTDNCDYIQTSKTTKYTCCQGYTTAPSPSDYHHHLYSSSKYYLKRNGCPRAIVNTTLQCLIELGLNELTSLITDLPIETTLNALSQTHTIFAPTNEILSKASTQLEALPEDTLHTVVKSHVVGGDLPAVKLYDGQKKGTLADGRFLHVTEIELKRLINTYRYEYYERIFINGQELLSRDACIASNGRVHIIKGIIDSSNKTISQIVQNSQNLTTLTMLLTTANLIGYLNRPLPLLTLFAPTNTAFETASCDLGVDILKCLQAHARRSALKKILLYHITCGAEYSASMVLRKKLTTKACHIKRYPYYHYKYYSRKYYKICKKVKVKVANDGGITLGGGAILTHLDIPASNGVIHYTSLPLVHPWFNLRELCKAYPKVSRNVAPPPPPLLHPPPN